MPVLQPSGVVATKIETSSASKAFGTQTASKASETFNIDASEIPIELASLPTIKNVQDAMEQLGTRKGVSVLVSAPVSPVEGDIWYETGTDKLYVRDDDSWNHITDTNTSVTNVDGGTFT